MKWCLRILTILLILVIIASATSIIILKSNNKPTKVLIEGTGFVLQELNGVGGECFDVDDYGNIYFAITAFADAGIAIYDSHGSYKYTLPIESSNMIGVRVGSNNDIQVCDARTDIISIYNNQGIFISSENTTSYTQRMEYLKPGYERERNGIHYINNGGTISREENGIDTVVFTVPSWQRWNGTCSLIMILSIVALFLRIAIPLWVKAYKERYR